MLKSKKIILAGTILVAGAIAMAGTFAWFTDSDEVVNKMKLARFDVKITEDYDPEENTNLEPNAEVDKVVKVVNKGTADAVVRVKIEEKLRLFKAEEGASEPTIFWSDAKISDEETAKIAVPNYIMPENAETVEVRDENNNLVAEYYKAVTSLKDGDTQCYVAKVDNYDGLVRYNPSLKALEYGYYEYEADTVADTDNYFTPEFNDTDWTKVGDYYYYNVVVKPGEVTAPLFSKVNVSKDLPNTYIGARYELTPKMDAVQANEDAVTSTWTDAGDISALLTAWNLK